MARDDNDPTQNGTVQTRCDNGVTVITLCRPEVRNAVDGPTATALAHRTFCQTAPERAWCGMLNDAAIVPSPPPESWSAARKNRLRRGADGAEAVGRKNPETMTC